MKIDDAEYVVLDVDVVELDRLAAIYAGGDRDAFLSQAIRVMAAREHADAASGSGPCPCSVRPRASLVGASICTGGRDICLARGSRGLLPRERQDVDQHGSADQAQTAR